MTYGGGPEGGIVKSHGDGWYVWHRTWGPMAQYTRIPDELEVIHRCDDGHETVKLVLSSQGYECGDYDYYLDDIEHEFLNWDHRINNYESDEDDEGEEEDDASDLF